MDKIYADNAYHKIGESKLNFLDYLDWRGDIKFKERPINEVDNLIFSTLAYTDMEGLVRENGITISELYQAYVNAGYDQSNMVINPKLLLEKTAKSERYKSVLVKCYVNEIDTEKHLQFSAVTFEIDEKLYYIAYRGTDNTLAGWHEDCNMSYLPKTPGQFEAAEYLNKISAKSKHDLIIGGHSKGGNFAVYAAAFCKSNIRERILKVYSNDGPGFNNTIANSKEYLDIIPKTEHIITDSSIVGILLSSKSKNKVIKSSAMGFDQHNPYTWNVLCTEFEKADGLSPASVFMDIATSKWIDSLNDDSKKILIDSVFNSLELSGATTINDISDKKWEVYNSVLKAITVMNTETRNEIGNSIKKLFDAGRDAIVKGIYK